MPTDPTWRNRMNEITYSAKWRKAYVPKSRPPGTLFKFDKDDVQTYQVQATGSLLRVQ
jgi:hypothetical protein